jgi:hypothetical protein
MAYTLVAESKGLRLLGVRFTADTAYEALSRLKRIQRRGFMVKITGADGKAVNEEELEAIATAARQQLLRPGDFVVTKSASGT